MTKTREKTGRELFAEIEEGKKKDRQLENREKYCGRSCPARNAGHTATALSSGVQYVMETDGKVNTDPFTDVSRQDPQPAEHMSKHVSRFCGVFGFIISKYGSMFCTEEKGKGAISVRWIQKYKIERDLKNEC